MICPYCQMNTGGQHEYMCSNNPYIGYIAHSEEYIWHGGHRYRLVLDDPEEMHWGNIRFVTHVLPDKADWAIWAGECEIMM